jgi:hypothetical protein
MIRRENVKTLTITAVFEGEKGYIGNPYWPAVDQVINIQKESGINRARSEANRRKALEGYLNGRGMKLDDYNALLVTSKRPWHRADDPDEGEIVIPAERILSFLVHATDEARAAQRPCDKNQIRARVFSVSDWRTGKFKADGIWTRFITPTSGPGAKLSNQRRYHEDQFITGFTATGELSVDEQFVKPETLAALIRWGGEFIGIGAARKMGYGRFEGEVKIASVAVPKAA